MIGAANADRDQQLGGSQWFERNGNNNDWCLRFNFKHCVAAAKAHNVDFQKHKFRQIASCIYHIFCNSCVQGVYFAKTKENKICLDRRLVRFESLKLPFTGLCGQIVCANNTGESRQYGEATGPSSTSRHRVRLLSSSRPPDI